MFDDIIDEIRQGGEGIDYAAIADRLHADATSMSDGYTATLSAKDQAIAALTADKAALQAHNYKLMMAANAEPLEPVETNPSPGITGVADLFK